MKIYFVKIIDFSDGMEQIKAFTNFLDANGWMNTEIAKIEKEEDCWFDVQVWDTTESKVVTIMTASS